MAKKSVILFIFIMAQSIANAHSEGTDYTIALKEIAQNNKNHIHERVILPSAIKRGLTISTPQIYIYPKSDIEFQELIQMAELGHAESNYLLALIYGDQRLPKEELDYQKAVFYLKRTIEIYPTFANALYGLAMAYDSGYGVEHNIHKAIELYEQAGIYGSYQAYARLSSIYAIGKEVPRNLEKAKNFNSKAAQLGDPMSTAIWLQWDQVVKKYYSD